MSVMWNDHDGYWKFALQKLQQDSRLLDAIIEAWVLPGTPTRWGMWSHAEWHATCKTETRRLMPILAARIEAAIEARENRA